MGAIAPPQHLYTDTKIRKTKSTNGANSTSTCTTTRKLHAVAVIGGKTVAKSSKWS